MKSESLISRTVLRIMEERDLDRASMSKLVDPQMNPSVISHWIYGDTMPSDDNIMTLAELGDVLPEALLWDKFLSRAKRMGIKIRPAEMIQAIKDRENRRGK